MYGLCDNYCRSSESESLVRSMIIGIDATESRSSAVKSMTTGMTGATGAQVWTLNTRCVIISPQPHFAKSLLNSSSDRPGLILVLSLASRSATNLLAGRLYVGTDSGKHVVSVKSPDRIKNKNTHQQPPQARLQHYQVGEGLDAGPPQLQSR
jgi:hypothetical protein